MRQEFKIRKGVRKEGKGRAREKENEEGRKGDEK